ncbi:MAG: segregation and condensation protein A [Gammaproteobacteria bacterium]|nr:segregation and condensation protein A [Gammaproteobacteria bacterium]
MSQEKLTKEEEILRAVYLVLIDVVKDTTTDPRLKHPLAERTRLGIRDCLDLITARQAELSKLAGRATGQMRPHYADEAPSSVNVSLKAPRPVKDKDRPH